MPEQEPCRWLGYAHTPIGQFVAKCSCGWKSEPYGRAGLAAAASDEHQVERVATRTSSDDFIVSQVG